jgi:hypothetical protein
METALVTQNPVLPFAEPTQPPPAAPDAIASDNSLLDIDREIDVMLDLMQDELEETGEISEESQNRFERFCEAFGQKVDRVGRFIRVMEAREAYCKSEAARLAARGKTAENKAAQTKALVLYFLETRTLTSMPAWRTVHRTTTASSARLRRERSSKASPWPGAITSASPDDGPSPQWVAFTVKRFPQGGSAFRKARHSSL